MKLKFYTNNKNFNYTDGDRQIIKNDISEMLDVLGYLLNILVERNTVKETYKYPIGTLINKFVIHIYNIITLMDGTVIKSNYLKFEKNIFDISSIYILTRSVIENYLTFFYLYVQPSNDQEIFFRYQLFELAGLNSRQRFNAEHDEHVRLKEEEKERILELENTVYNHTLFLKLNKRTRDNLMGRKSARIFSWTALFNEADLNINLFKPGWMLYSEFAHSEYVSQIQLNGYLTEELSSKKSCDLTSNILLSIVSVLIIDLTQIFEDVEERFNSLNNDVKEVVKFFNGVGRK